MYKRTNHLGAIPIPETHPVEDAPQKKHPRRRCITGEAKICIAMDSSQGLEPENERLVVQEFEPFTFLALSPSPAPILSEALSSLNSHTATWRKTVLERVERCQRFYALDLPQRICDARGRWCISRTPCVSTDSQWAISCNMSSENDQHGAMQS